MLLNLLIRMLHKNSWINYSHRWLLLPKLDYLKRTFMSEISTTICHLAPSKAPGPDGFTEEFYKTLQKIVGPTLSNVYTGMWTGGPISHLGCDTNLSPYGNKWVSPNFLPSVIWTTSHLHTCSRGILFAQVPCFLFLAMCQLNLCLM